MTRNNLNKRLIKPTGDLANFLKLDDEMTPLDFMSTLWTRLYQSGSVVLESGERAHRRRKRDREANKRRRRLTRR